MKKIILPIFLILVICTIIKNYSIAQTPVTIYTPKGSVVPDTYLTPEFTPDQIAQANNYAMNLYPNAIRLADASATYNCHGYAWRVSEGGSNVWIGYHTSTAEDIYWNDKSYIELCNQSYPAKVSYGLSDDHSAITTNQPDIFVSKWGNLPLMQHNKNYSPYNSSNLKYYIKPPSITGSSAVCSSGATFTINNLPLGCSVLWDKTGNLNLTPIPNTKSGICFSKWYRYRLCLRNNKFGLW